MKRPFTLSITPLEIVTLLALTAAIAALVGFELAVVRRDAAAPIQILPAPGDDGPPANHDSPPASPLSAPSDRAALAFNEARGCVTPLSGAWRSRVRRSRLTAREPLALGFIPGGRAGSRGGRITVEDV